MAEITYSQNTISLAEQTQFMIRYAAESNPPLNERTDISEFSGKLKKYAVSFEAREKNEIIGLLCAYINDEERKNAYISYFRVNPDFRGRGIGHHLLENCFALCRRRNFNTVSLEVSKTNKRAISLYAQVGFCITREDEYSNFMTLKLSNSEL